MNNIKKSPMSKTKMDEEEKLMVDTQQRRMLRAISEEYVVDHKKIHMRKLSPRKTTDDN